MPPLLYLIDGHALAYRTYYAITAAGGGERLQTKAGEPTAGVYGFASVLLRLLEQEKPEYLAVAFDTGKTFRDDLYPDYKATRVKMPDDLRPQIERIRQLIDAFGIPRLEVEGFEADDVLGSVARQAVEKGFGVKILTGDRDLLQLVDDRVIVNLPGAKLSEARDYTRADVVKFFGVPPEQVIDYKALVGDTSDNIPGVPGIGDKTAVSLLETYPDLDAIYAHLEELPHRVRSRLEAGRDSAYLSRKLAAIRTDAPSFVEVEKARTDQLNYAAAEAIFQELEFRSLMARLRSLGQGDAATKAQMGLFEPAPNRIGTPPSYPLRTHIVTTSTDLQRLAERLKDARQVAFDTETTSTDPLRAKLVGVSLAIQEGEGYYIPLGHQTAETQLPLAEVLEALRPAMSDAGLPKIGHNLKYDYLVLAQHGLDVRPLSFDTMIAEWLIDPAARNLGLKNLAEQYLAATMTHIEELIGKGKAQRSMAEVKIDAVAGYAAADAEVTLRLKPILEKGLEERNAVGLFHQLEMPLIPVLAEMERTGIALDVPYFRQMSKELSQRMSRIAQQIYDQVGYHLNLNSTQQLSKLLFESLKLTPPDRRKRTSSGHFSTSADVLEEMRGQHPIVDWILEYRELSKLQSTYVEALPQQVNPATGRVHTSFNQTGSVTGRLASSDPNLQNIPTRTEIGRRVRHGFVAIPGNRLLSVDYSQIELRIVAHMSQDEAMLAAFRAGQDIHAATAAAILGVPIDQVNKDQRRHAKAINFGLIYGMSPFGLTRTTDLTLAEAEDFVKAYFRQFPRVKDYLDEMRRLASRHGYVETLLGRRRYFPTLSRQTNAAIRNREEREAINAPIQGSAADIIKVAMVRLPAALRTERLSAKMLLQVHDELVLECPTDELEPTAATVRQVMENAYALSIPLLTEARSGKNWGDLHPFD